MASSLMRPILASWPTSTASQRMSMAGIVSERLRSSSIRDSQLTLDLLPLAFGSTTTDERKFDTPPSRAMLLVEIWLVVFGAACTTLAPVSRSCPAPANVMPVNSMRAPSPCRTLIGYRQPVWEPNEPETQLDRAALFDPRTLGVQVVHILGPVFNRGVAHARTLTDENLDAACVQVGDVVLRGRAALDKVQVCALVHDNQGVLELARAGGVQAEVGLQGNVHMHARRDVDEGTAAPHSAVQRRKLVVRGGHALHEVLLHHCRRRGR